MRYLNLHTHTQTGDPSISELLNQYPDAFDNTFELYSIGIHPWRINEERLEADLFLVETKLADKKCLAIGECGLDKRIATPISLQVKVFETQLRLAQSYKKPVIVHCVAAYQEVIDIHKKLGISVPMVIHGFSKNEKVAKQLLDNGFRLSFGKWLLRNPELETAFCSIPDNRLFLETDTAEETISEVYALAARYRKVSVEKVKEIVWRNFERDFLINNANQELNF